MPRVRVRQQRLWQLAEGGDDNCNSERVLVATLGLAEREPAAARPRRQDIT